ncbi:TIGR03943 family putative permease subunit [Sutcliffiella rhizosphaerae]|uniref:DUF1980 domain-containing protein n=1 Tax=Sutcliffiella rhizosphaerae TaxID=2880967 RepID=A0ABN8ABW5_9BACI|nr:hypothetical protein [Sutcliffiella rhizosphaerae]CAG9622708.1 hypothetical protein BACCIP111883_03499 [Sutcliffiella rhizosphaerae]
MNKKAVVIIAVLLGIAISGVFVFYLLNKEEVTSRPDTENADLKRAEEYLADPEGYMESLEEKHEDDHDEEGDLHDHDHSHGPEKPEEFYENIKSELLKENMIVIPDKEYIHYLDTIGLFPEDFSGKEIEYTGFIYREPSFNKDEVVIGRYTCCEKEKDGEREIIGLLSTASNASEYEENDWVKVKGLLETTDYGGNSIPFLRIKELELIHPPEDPYVYEEDEEHDH